MKKALLSLACWLAIILAFAGLVVLVGPCLIAALVVELVEEG